MQPIYLVNNFGQSNHLIKRMLRDLEIDAVMIKNDTPAEEVEGNCRGIILSGGPSLERAGSGPEYVDLGVPVLGICLGLHIIATRRGGSVQPGKMGGFGGVEVKILEDNPLFEGYPDKISVWASHADEVNKIPEGFTLAAVSDICPAEAISKVDENIYGIQWHPEVSHTFEGSRIFENFDRITRENL
ncbi:GMP synthase subunit A [Methanoplanus limicola]|uniref:GMP synthase [glutamine-hydrolyzing] subunit A n=1 Tax=Methanoplanus limicola DSM 2279 TaxID=937775 RepID=H1YWW3_9EURY|nr:GMP synthase subunit A [Methanoplanus limicola]EHQ34886.1 GMP synthase (glutamine-hydrolyzing) subunit A [Methanoplanus limicola DSM 2279]